MMKWKKFMKDILNKSVWYNLLVMAGIAIVGFMTVAWGLDFYTSHGEKVAIPRLAGKSLNEAIQLLEDADLRYEVVDSVYSKEARPGTIVEVYPEEGLNVKPNRIIFLKIYTSEPPKVAIPHVKDMSARQAYALLKAMGFENISQKIVPGDYIGSCQGLALQDGSLLTTGAYISKDTPIVLLVTGTVIVPDSINVDDLMTPEGAAADTSTVSGTSETTPSRKENTSKTDEPTEKPEQWW